MNPQKRGCLLLEWGVVLVWSKDLHVLTICCAKGSGVQPVLTLCKTRTVVED